MCVMAALSKLKLGKKYVPVTRGEVYYDYVIPLSVVGTQGITHCAVGSGEWRCNTILNARHIVQAYRLEKPIQWENK